MSATRTNSSYELNIARAHETARSSKIYSSLVARSLVLRPRELVAFFKLFIYTILVKVLAVDWSSAVIRSSLPPSRLHHVVGLLGRTLRGTGRPPCWPSFSKTWRTPSSLKTKTLRCGEGLRALEGIPLGIDKTPVFMKPCCLLQRSMEEMHFYAAF